MKKETTVTFEHGDTVFVVLWDKESWTDRVCGFCKGDKTVVAHGETRDCPKCGGKGVEFLNSYHFVARVVEARVVDCDDYENERTYTVTTTDGHALSLHNEAVFATQEEAQKTAMRQIGYFGYDRKP